MTEADISGADWLLGFSDTVVSRLRCHVAMLQKWNPAINLVAPSSLRDVWTRHVHDSVQLFHLRGDACRHWADLGSGAGFPGLVVAILAFELAPEMRVTLVESDHRKAEFLRSVSRETGLALTVHDSRIESLPPLQADVVSARALAPLSALCSYAARHLAPTGRALFPKGARVEEEVRTARAAWRFALHSFPSITDAKASVLVLKELHRA